MSLDDALTLAGQVLADYEASGLDAAPGVERIWPGRLAGALRDLSAASAAWYASPAGGPSPDGLGAVVRQLHDGAARVEEQASRLEAASTALARQPATLGGSGSGSGGRWRRRLRGTRAGPAPAPGSVLLTPAEAATAWQATADAAAWHMAYRDCAGCVSGGTCADPARHQVLGAAYAALKARLGGERP
jgi:hypothetical protein